MKVILKITFLFFLLAHTSFAQRGKNGLGNISGTTIVNSYTTLSVDAPSNSTSITVADASILATGDLIMIIQMQGASVNVINGGTVAPWFDTQAAEPTDTSFGRITNYNGAGNNELAEISSVNIITNTVTLDCGLRNSYLTSGKTQIVKVPRYTSLSITATGIITCPHWDRTLGYGGVIAIEVQGNTTIANGGKIDASGLGFRGGAFWFKSTSSPGSTRWGALYRDQGINKGESIAGDTSVYAIWAAKFCKGSIANGGGGGNSINAGGGGGANAGLTNKYFGGIGNIDTTTNSNYITAWTLENTATVAPLPLPLPLWRANTNSGGGRGGYTFSGSTSSPLTVGPNSATWSGDGRKVQGGLGGRPLDYSSGQLYLGGGGGSGDGENYYQGAGGDGGGIIYIMNYGTISGGGQIISNGANGSASITNITRAGDGFNVLGRDGAGGGGGGGAIVVNSVGSISGISINADGGKGGNNEMINNGGFTAMAYGPGGGGGGGYINIPMGNTVTTSTTSGTNGTVIYLSGLENCKIDNTNGTGFPPNGATKGGPGISSSTITNFVITTSGTTICAGNSATVSASINGTPPNPITINWYTDSIGGNPLNTGANYTTPILNTTTSYWVGTCPGTYREKVTVIVSPAPAAPVANSPVNYCQNETVIALSATATGSNTIVWYDAASGGNILSAPIIPSTAAVGTTNYYVAQSNGSCTGARTQVTVNVVALPSAPLVSTPVDYCQNSPANAISATASGMGNTVFYWGTASTGGISSTTATVPVTSVVGSTQYYVSESNGTCESPRTAITVNVNAQPVPPVVADTVSYCQGQLASQLTPTGAGINWYTNATGGSSIPAPTPNTTNVGITTYYVSQIQNNCESLRDSVKVVVNTSFSAPSATNVSYCLNSSAVALNPNGAGYNWYASATGGTATSTIIPVTVTTGTVSYYVSQGSGTCESPRTQVDVVTLALPNKPTGSDTTYCLNETAIPLTATASGTLNWYTGATGGVASATAPTPSTASVGDTDYFVSQTDANTCESSRDTITITINPIPVPPMVTDTVSYCQNQVASQLTPNGAGINWYANATGGSSIPAPTPNTTNVGITTYYVSQTQNNCESLRDSVKVIVNTSFSAPSATNVSYCLNSLAVALSPNGTGYNWYTTAIGGTANTTIVPSTAATGTVSYYVSQGSATCESPRTQVDVVTLALPNKPNGSDTTYCLNESAIPLTATASGTLNWYTSATGGVASATAPTPSTASLGNTDYFVSQTDANTCEGARDTITVSVINLQNAPGTSNISYCQGANAVQLTANGNTQLNWWGTAAAGGTPSTTAPTPLTASAGTTTYYVSQGTGACESPRAGILVTINSNPVITFTQNVSTICENKCVNFNANTSANCVSLAWDFGNGNTGNTSTPTACYSSSGAYTVKVTCTDNLGCSGSSIVSNAVIVNTAPTAQFSMNPSSPITPATTVNFIADTGLIKPTIAWDFGDPGAGTLNNSAAYNPSHLYSEAGTFCIKLKVEYTSCKDSITKCIEVFAEPVIEIPNVFTPNNDNINDLFSIKSTSISEIETSLYDRWGIPIIQNAKQQIQNNVTIIWDGKMKNGNKASNGVYYYIINAKDYKGEYKQYSGYLQLMGMN